VLIDLLGPAAAAQRTHALQALEAEAERAFSVGCENYIYEEERSLPFERSVLHSLELHAPTPADDAARARLLAYVRSLARSLWGARAEPFGSTATGLYFSRADLDICVLPLTASGSTPQPPKALYALAGRLRGAGFVHIQPITHARVPIVKFVEPQSGMQCDISLSNALALRNSALLRFYSDLDPRVRPLALAVKLWASRRGINDPPSQTLSSYAYVLLVVAYLQQVSPPILPNLQQIANPSSSMFTSDDRDGRAALDKAIDAEIRHQHGGSDCKIDTFFCADLPSVRTAFAPKKNPLGVGGLLRGFFWYVNTQI